MLTQTQDNRLQFLFDIFQRQPYRLTLEGFDLVILKGTFPPDVGTASVRLSRLMTRYAICETALDMGCGSGLLAMAMRRAGIPDVWAVDIHPPAVQCAKVNVLLNPAFAPITVLEGNLFSILPPDKRFDLICFNHFYYSTEGIDHIFGRTSDGGSEIIRRFLIQAHEWLAPQGVILMPFSLNLTNGEHDPAQIGSGLGWRVSTILDETDSDGRHVISELASV